MKLYNLIVQFPQGPLLRLNLTREDFKESIINAFIELKKIMLRKANSNMTTKTQ